MAIKKEQIPRKYNPKMRSRREERNLFIRILVNWKLCDADSVLEELDKVVYQNLWSRITTKKTLKKILNEPLLNYNNYYFATYRDFNDFCYLIHRQIDFIVVRMDHNMSRSTKRYIGTLKKVSNRLQKLIKLQTLLRYERGWNRIQELELKICGKLIDLINNIRNNTI